MKLSLLICLSALAVGAAACGGTDVEGKTLAEAQKELRAEGVKVQVTSTNPQIDAQAVDQNAVTVCDQEPDTVSKGDTANLQVDESCPEEGGSGKKKKKRKRR